MERRYSRQKPLPVGGKVPYRGSMMTIVSRQGANADLRYALRGIGEARDSDIWNVPHADLLASIESYARYALGDLTPVGYRGQKFRVWNRKWSFEQGTVIYMMGDLRKRIVVKPFTQESLMQAEERLKRITARGIPRGDGPLEYWESYSDW